MNIDKSKLSFSNKTSLTGIEEVDVNLVLNTAINDNLGEIKGTVKDENGNPIPNATVKIFEQDHTPFMHSITDENGEYRIMGIPSDSYKINASAIGYLFNTTSQIFVDSNDVVEFNCTLQKDEASLKNTIAGLIYLEGTTTPIGNVKLIVSDSNGDTVCVTYSASDGEFLITDLSDGIYSVEPILSGYKSSVVYDYEVKNGKIYNVIINMISVQIDIKGTYTGQILDQTNTPVSGAIVGLYKITETGEKLIMLSKTNDEGRYMFGNVQDGEYVVKAKNVNTVATSFQSQSNISDDINSDAGLV